MRALSVLVVTSPEVRIGLPYSTVKRQKLAKKFPRAETKPLERETFILNRQISVRPPEKHTHTKKNLSLTVIHEITFWGGVFRKIRSAKESEVTYFTLRGCLGDRGLQASEERVFI